MYKYNVGIFGGTFNPIHNGHIKCIEIAVKECKELHIIVSNTLNRESVEYSTKIKWMHKLFGNYTNIIYHEIKDITYSKDEYTIEDFLNDAKLIKDMVGKKIDVVYCGSDYDVQDSPYNICFSESKIVFLDRRDNISSSRFKSNPELYKSDVPAFVYEYYNKK